LGEVFRGCLVVVFPGDVSPLGVTFNNSGANTYTLTGTNAITGVTGLIKQGDGLLII